MAKKKLRSLKMIKRRQIVNSEKPPLIQGKRKKYVQTKYVRKIHFDLWSTEVLKTKYGKLKQTFPCNMIEKSRNLKNNFQT